MTVNIHKAKTDLSKLLEAVERGEEVVIARAGKPVPKLVKAEEPPAKRKLGLWEGPGFWIADDFDAPNEEIRRMFEDGDI
jgi:prevent-host-death family protein